MHHLMYSYLALRYSSFDFPTNCNRFLAQRMSLFKIEHAFKFPLYVNNKSRDHYRFKLHHKMTVVMWNSKNMVSLFDVNNTSRDLYRPYKGSQGNPQD